MTMRHVAYVALLITRVDENTESMPFEVNIQSIIETAPFALYPEVSSDIGCITDWDIFPECDALKIGETLYLTGEFHADWYCDYWGEYDADFEIINYQTTDPFALPDDCDPDLGWLDVLANKPKVEKEFNFAL